MNTIDGRPPHHSALTKVPALLCRHYGIVATALAPYWHATAVLPELGPRLHSPLSNPEQKTWLGMYERC